MPRLKTPTFVDTDAKLGALVQAASRASVIAVDTEANTLHAYREKLCLLQVTVDDADVLVDPLAGLDLSLLAPVLADVRITKIFHDAEGDVGLLRRAWPFEIRGLFDTKVAAASLGLGSGLAALLQSRYGVTLDKRLQRSDWGRRPLTAAQMDYARQDTRYLARLAEDLRSLLKAADLECQLEVAAECRRLETWCPDPREFDHEDAFDIKGAESLDPQGRRALRALFVLRHQIADAEDRPAFKVLGNEMLLSLARTRPSDREGLTTVAELPARLAERHGEEILVVLGEAAAEGPLPRPARRAPGPEDGARAVREQIYEALRSWRRQVAEKRGTDASLVLPKTTMLKLARLEPVPRTLSELAETRLLEPFRLERHGAAILAAFTAGNTRRRR